MMDKQKLADLAAEALSENLREVCRVLAGAGHRAYVVGGWLRDIILGRAAGDADVATTARPEEVEKLFSRTIPTGIAHGTVTVRLGQGSYEVTTLRGDGIYSDGRRPDTVSFVNDIHDDLSRRDFTMNAIAYEPETGEVHDSFGGMEDMEKHLIRAVGNPSERFAEDGLRCMRAARFSAVLDFDIEEETLRAIPGSLDTFRKVSPERVRMELVKLIAGHNPAAGLEVLLSTGLLREIMPELADCVGSDQNAYHKYDVFRHSVLTCKNLPASDPVLRLAGLVHDVGKPVVRVMDEKKNDYVFHGHEKTGARIVDRWMEKLKFSNADRERVVHLVRYHGYHYTDEWTDAAVRRFIRKVGVEHLEDLHALREADIVSHGEGMEHESLVLLNTLRERVEKELAKQSAINVSDLAVKGSDLIDGLQIAPGPVIGTLLEMLLDHVTEHPQENNRKNLMAKARYLLEKALESSATDGKS